MSCETKYGLKTQIYTTLFDTSQFSRNIPPFRRRKFLLLDIRPNVMSRNSCVVLIIVSASSFFCPFFVLLTFGWSVSFILSKSAFQHRHPPKSSPYVMEVKVKHATINHWPSQWIKENISRLSLTFSSQCRVMTHFFFFFASLEASVNFCRSSLMSPNHQNWSWERAGGRAVPSEGTSLWMNISIQLPFL